MIIRRGSDIRSSSITDEQAYLHRRDFIRLAGSAAAAAVVSPLVAGCGTDTLAAGAGALTQTALSGIQPKVVTTDE